MVGIPTMAGHLGEDRRDGRSQKLPCRAPPGRHRRRFTSALWGNVDRRESILHQARMARVDPAILAASPRAFLPFYGVLCRYFLAGPEAGRKREYTSGSGVGVSPAARPAGR